MHNEDDYPEAVRIEINGVLDLHHFSPKEIKTLIPDYLDECLQKNILEVRIIHGKGRGVLKRTVEAILARLPVVSSFQMADPERANWGATIVRLKKPADKK
jgi:DNA-nicking Smr family endonuclease